MAARSKAELQVVHVSPVDGRAHDTTQLDRLRRLADDLGGHWYELESEDPAAAMMGFATDHQVTQIVLGATKRGRFEEMRRGSIIRNLLREAGKSEIDIHIIARKL